MEAREVSICLSRAIAFHPSRVFRVLSASRGTPVTFARAVHGSHGNFTLGNNIPVGKPVIRTHSLYATIQETGPGHRSVHGEPRRSYIREGPFKRGDACRDQSRQDPADRLGPVLSLHSSDHSHSRVASAEGVLSGAFRTKRLPAHVSRTVIGTISTELTSVAVQNIPLPEVVTPVFATAVCRHVFEVVHWRKGWAFRCGARAFGFIGVLMIS